ncbi:MAG: TerC family protein [Pirellulaceae bacterium]
MDFLPLAAIDILGQKLDATDIGVILLLVVLEGVLSIDNALVLGLLAKRLPKHQRARALSYGLIGAFVFRVIAICTASFLLQWTVVKFIGGGYLVYIAVKHLFFEAKEEHEQTVVTDASGNPQLVDEETGKPLTAAEEDLEIRGRVPMGTSLLAGEESVDAEPGEAAVAKSTTGKPRSFWGTVLVIELTDIAFAVDSILAAMALAGARQSKLWVVVTGGIIGVIMMRFAAAMFVRLLEKFPRFELSAYLLVIVIGLKLLADWGFNSDWSFDKPQFVATRLGTWKQSFENVEKGRLKLIHDYDGWLEKRWPFGSAGHSHDAPHKEEAPAIEEGKPNVELPPHVPHLLNFHNVIWPECMAFWVIMIICFAIGFIPHKSHHAEKPAAK